MNVVTRAISTIMENSAGEMIFRSRPMFRITSSISPRVFMRTPMTEASRHPSPQARPASAEPPNFPAQATRMIRIVSSHSSGLLSRPICVRSPVYAKKIGSRKITV